MESTLTTRPVSTLLVFMAALIGISDAQVASAAEVNLGSLSSSEGFVIHGSGRAAFAGQGVTPASDLLSPRDLIISEPGSKKVHVVPVPEPNWIDPVDLANINAAGGFTITGINVGFGRNEKTIATDRISVNMNDTDIDFAVGGYTGVNVIWGRPTALQGTHSIAQLAADGIATRLDPDNAFGPHTSLDFYRDFDIDTVHLMMSSRKGTATGKTHWWYMDSFAPDLSSGGSAGYGTIAALGDVDGFFWTGNKTGMVQGDVPNVAWVDDSAADLKYFVADHQLGNIAPIGDIDSDQVTDFAIGARSNRPDRPIAYVIYGKKEWEGEYFPPVTDLTAMTPDEGFAVRVIDNVDTIGYVADSSGSVNGTDVDGDGITDIVIGSSATGRRHRRHRGKVYVIFGNTDRSEFGSEVDVTTTDGVKTASIVAARKGDGLGASVAVSGGMIVMGARRAHVQKPGARPRKFAGKVYGLYPKPRPW